jgi:nucleotide-binding universal stress UspA family protein
MITPQTLRSLDVILAVDGSDHSLAAVQLLGDLPLPPESTVTALSVLDQHFVNRKSILLAILEKTQAMLQEKGLNVKTGLLHGNPAEAVAHYAGEQHPGLIVLGARGLRSALGILLGGVAQQVVEYACCPVLVVRAPYTGIHQVLLAVDGSKNAKYALEYLTQFPFPEGVQMHAVHVLSPEPHPETAFQSWALYPEISQVTREEEIAFAEDWRARQEEDGRAILEVTLKRLQGKGLQATGAMLRGDAATEIIAYAKANAIDLIVSGSRGLSEMKGWLLGSVSRKLIHYASCSGLVVKSLPVTSE